MDDTGPGPALPGETREHEVPRRPFALKDGDVFLVADDHGDIQGDAQGLYREDTRVLSRWRLLLDGGPPLLLNAAAAKDNVVFTANGANRSLASPAAPALESVVHVERERFLWQGRLFERVRCTNYGRTEVTAQISLEYAADFEDIFVTRGFPSLRRGQALAPEIGPRSAGFRYQGLDGVLRASVVAFSAPPDQIGADRASFALRLAAGGSAELYVEVGPDAGPAPGLERFRAAEARARLDMRSKSRRGARLRCSERRLDDWIRTSRADLALLTTDLETGPYPYAGVPWFSTTFGRDGLITAWQMLWIDPSLARGVLAFLAASQAQETSVLRDCQPGKILHEARKGELTAIGDLPFGRYYGSVDSTPLFAALAGAYADRTGDLDFIDRLWPALLAAVDWIDRYGDCNGDGLVDYRPGEGLGLANQGWKDSSDSVFHADGVIPSGPIALVEVQGYAFAAFRAMAGLAERRGDGESAKRWRARAERLRQAVEERFWMEDLGTYGLAIDGEGRLCRVRASNAGHLLFCGLPSPERARRVTQELLSARFCSGWGMRTLAVGEARYNPMSYHNGSVWPHDAALCAAGMARYGEREGVLSVLAEIFEAASSFDMRLPELFCGFERTVGEPPTPYPVACLPQAWSAGSVFMLLQACLGLDIDGWRKQIVVDHPCLPIGVDRLRVEGLAVGPAMADLVLERAGEEAVAATAESADPAVTVITRG